MPIIREKKQSRSAGPVGVVRMNLGGTEKYSRIADATQKLTTLSVSEMSRQSQLEGQRMAQDVDPSQIIALNPETGKPKALDWVGENRLFGRAGVEAYERVVQERFQSSMETELKTKASEIALKFKDNPYGAEQYKQQMDEYLKSMALGSEVDGKATYYTNFIMSQGEQYIASTTLHMQEQQINRQRQITAQSIVDNVSDRLDAIRQYAQLGKDAGLLIDSILESIGDGESSFLLNQGSSAKYQQAAAVAYAEGVIAKTFGDLSHESAGNVSDAITLGDPSSLTAQERKVFDEASKYMVRSVDVGNGRTAKVLDYDALSAVSAYASQSATDVLNDYNSEIKASRFLIKKNSESLVRDFTSEMSNAISQFDNPELNTVGVYGSVIRTFENLKVGLRNEASINELSVPEYTAQVQQLREASSKELMLVAFDSAEGSPAEIGRMINEALDTGDTTNFTGTSKAALDTILEITTSADNGFLDGVVSDFVSNDARSSAKYAAEQGLYQREISTKYLRLIGAAGSTQESGELLEEFMSRIDGFDFLSTTQRDNYKNEAKNQSVKVFLASKLTGVVEAEGPDGVTIRRKINSNDLAIAAEYAATGEKEGVPTYITDMVDLAESKEGVPGYTETRLTQLTSRVGISEAKNSERVKSEAVVSNLLSSVVVKDTSPNRKIAEGLITAGMEDPEAYFRSTELLNPNNPSTLALYKVIESGVVPPMLASNFKQLANGTFTGNDNEARSLISLYSHFSRQPRDGLSVNNWNNTELSSDTKARLETLSILSTALEAPLENIANQLAEATTEKARLARIAAFKADDGSNSDAEFVLNSVPDVATNPEARGVLVGLAKYLYGPMSSGEIRDALVEYYDSTFTDTEGYIKDVASLSGTRSQHSLSRVFRNPDLKRFFIDKVNVDIAEAFARAGLKGGGRYISNRNIKNRGFLMPMGSSSGGAANYMLVEQSSGTIIPVVNPMTGIPFQFSSHEPDVLEKAQSLAVKEAQVNETITFEEVLDLRTERSNRRQTSTSVEPGVSSIAGGVMQILDGN